MDKLKVFKFAASVVVGVGTTRIVSGIIRSNVTPKSTIQKLTVMAASLVIGSMAARATRKHLDEMIEEAIEGWKEALIELKKLQDAIADPQ